MIETEEKLQKIALNFLKGMTPELLKTLHEAGRDYRMLFTEKNPERTELFSILKIDEAQVKEAMERAKVELDFMERHSIKMLFVFDDDYPSMLYEITNPPITLFYLGDLKLESAHKVSMVGTRRCTQSGIKFCKDFVGEIAEMFPDLSVVSGLAYGIDASAHCAALEAGCHTIGIVAHGLDMIYPARHRNLAREILAKGGALLTEYPSTTKPYKGRFLERNRIVACLADAVIVVESAVRGGAMSTANTAFSYSREVFAVPGRITDEVSQGCNLLIMKNKARLTTGSADFIKEMGWQPQTNKTGIVQKELFPELDGDARLIYEYLRNQRKPCSTDSIRLATSLSISKILTALGELEFDGIVVRLPGSRYETIG